MKVYEYVWKLKDQFSPAMEKIKRLSQSTKGTVNSLSNRVQAFGNSAAASGRKAKYAFLQGRDAAGRFQKQVVNTNAVLSSLRTTLLSFIGITAFMGLGRDIVNTTAEIGALNTAIEFASGSAAAAAQNFQFLDKTADMLGQPIDTLKDGFRTLSGSMKGTVLEGKGTRDIFQAVTVASTAMQLSADQTQGALLAVGQIMSKGKVQAEELRGQLGERLPGAFNIAAKAMGVTTQQLDKLLEQGKITAEQFLPLFARELQNTFAGGLEKASQSLRANLNRMNNEFVRTKVFVGEQLTPVINQAAAAFVDLMKWIRANWSTVKQYAKVVGQIIGLFVTWKATAVALTLATKGYIAVMGFAQTATVLLTKGFAGLNIVMRANPIGLVATAITALIGVMTWAYNKFDWFKGGVWGLWEAFKEVFTSIGDMAKNIFGGIVDMISGVFTGNMKLAKQGLKDLSKGLVATSGIGFISQYGGNIANAYNKGYANGLAPDTPAAAAPGVDMSQFSGTAGSAAPGFDALMGTGGKSKKDIYSEFREIIAMAKNPSMLTREQRKNLNENITSAYNQIGSLLSLFELSNATGQKFDSLQGYNQGRLSDLQSQLAPFATRAEEEMEFKQGLSAITGGGKKVTNITIGEVKYADNVSVAFKDSREHASDMRSVIERELAELMNDFNRDVSQ